VNLKAFISLPENLGNTRNNHYANEIMSYFLPSHVIVLYVFISSKVEELLPYNDN